MNGPRIVLHQGQKSIKKSNQIKGKKRKLTKEKKKKKKQFLPEYLCGSEFECFFKYSS